ncbi:Putative CRISPR-associated nuclease/helicase Cas3 [Gemmata sp. SH-PL17]|uniref:CRISPR-associated helicase/endonuclease Cas3 n=1 Tax=Gemmata sp. SH-PL17 TaxID=1630693 RepID=UPI00078E0E5B|nr:CRISPR-associated helicase/endonuclease Cas3 [Gemmata sp. SH-PL17]AMV26282.1 Putative CRISPR-associated nuclease/helicase Cas3 [Gemmata sp. SH-PL17]
MSFANFTELFQQATGNPNPFPYQARFAEAENLPELVHAPTGAGKTATAVLGWLWRRFFANKPTPRRLVYCLPMRVLVEQTRDEARKWLKNLGFEEKVKVHVLMGGEDAEEWDLDPEKPTVLIGTQDMLLSRALNRGYGMGRFRWPMHYGLLNNDALWVLDEIQLMGTGLATSTQLQAFREALGVYGTVKTIWMSATLLPRWLASVDYRNRIEPELRLTTLQLDQNTDYRADGLRERWEAKKPIQRAALLRAAEQEEKAEPVASTEVVFTADESAKVAEFVKAKHCPGSLTLVIVNTVDRCRALFEAIRTLYSPKPRGRGKNATPSAPVPAPDLKLIHSRFRPKEREEWRSWLTAKELPALGRIIVSTQVVEAGVDLSARTLITELAPWPSLVQRFGRCNRRGEFPGENGTDPAQLFWIDVPTPATGAKKSLAPPYTDEELDQSRTRLATTRDVGLKSLTEFFDRLNGDERNALFPFDPPHVIRRKDFIDLFDTTPDLAGNDIDVSRFIRDGDEIDVQAFWRAATPPRGELRAAQASRIMPAREELCTVKIGDFRQFLEDHTAHRWDSLASEWIGADASAVYPGQVYWIATAEGGYDTQLGWNPSADWSADLWIRDPATESASETTEEPGYDTEFLSVYGWQSITEHTRDVLEALTTILKELNLNEVPREALALAIRWHDWGKAHSVFQDAIRDEPDGVGKRPKQHTGKRDIAKAAPEEVWQRYKRKHFRHELASALGVLTLLKSEHPPDGWKALDAHLTNLALYLIAAHHGKVRLSIRSMPDERTPDTPGALFARGVWEGDKLPAVDLGGGVSAPAVAALDLSPMLLGQVDSQPSWAERVLRLRDDKAKPEDTAPRFGPLKLAYLESLIRVADMRASKAADEKAKKPKGAQS